MGDERERQCRVSGAEESRERVKQRSWNDLTKLVCCLYHGIGYGFSEDRGDMELGVRKDLVDED